MPKESNLRLSEEYSLNKNEKRVKCNYCSMELPSKNDMNMHKKTKHNAFHPCRNISNCTYGNDCYYNHKKIS